MIINLYDQIFVPKDLDDENAGRRGVVFAISECLDSEEIAAYAVMFDGEDTLTMVPKEHVVPTGIKFKKADFYDE